MTMASNLKVWRLIPLLLLVVILCPFAHGKFIYVDDDATGANDGSSWQNAYTFLQDALADAETTEKPVEIHVAQGTYKPDQGVIQTLSDQTVTFQLINGVTLKGGYAGVNEPEPYIRDVEFFQTILSGDLSGNDIDVNDPGNLFDLPDRYDNSKIVVTGSNTDATAVLDGFTITGGYISVISYRLGGGPFGGAGMLISSGSPTLINCTFTDNATTNSGGGLLIDDDSNPKLVNCKFTRNYAYSGGGIFNSTSNPTLNNCIFDNNYAHYKGGAMFNFKSNPELTDCTFSGNSIPDKPYIDYESGGAIHNSNSNLVLNNCEFSDNTASVGAGMHNENNSSLILKNCTFRANIAELSGGGIFTEDSTDLKLIDCIFSGNSSKRSGGGLYSYKSNTILVNCVFIGNKAHGLLIDTWSYPRYGHGGGIFFDGNPTIINCTFRDNWAKNGAGIYSSGGPKLIKCSFINNSAENYGGGICNHSGRSDFTVANCTFSRNSAEWGGGIFLDFSARIKMANCTLTNNFASVGNALACDPNFPPYPGDIEVNNCILWDGDNTLFDPEPYPLRTAITYSNVQGGWEGDGNIDEDPRFTDLGYWADADDPNIAVEPDDPNAVWIDGDYHLKSQAGRWDPASESWIVDDVTSPCIDAGDPNSPVAIEPFPNGGIINMGAYGGSSQASKSPSGLHAKYGGGSGEPNDPYLIYTAEQMNTIGLHEEDWDKHFRLMADIDLSDYTGTDFNIIGLNYISPFDGVFDGNGHVVKNFTYSDSSRRIVGLFGLIGSTSKIRNIHLIDANVVGLNYVGLLVGYSTGTVSNCSATGSIRAGQYTGGLIGINMSGALTQNCRAVANVSGTSTTGGLVGANSRSVVINCSSDGMVSGTSTTGGITGRQDYGTVLNSFSTCIVSGTSYAIGGLVGRNNYSLVSGCFATGEVEGGEMVGGLVGFSDSEIANCYSHTKVIGFDNVGGLLGYNIYGYVSNSYSTGEVAGDANIGAFLGFDDGTCFYTGCFWNTDTQPSLPGISNATESGLIGVITKQLKRKETFITNGWDFVDEMTNGTEDIWWIDDGQDYPRLAWESE